MTEAEQAQGRILEDLGKAFCVIEVLFDPNRRAVDYRFLSTNAAFGPQTGLHDAEGCCITELMDGIEQDWFDAFGRVALTGRAERFEMYASAFGRWYESYAFPVSATSPYRLGVVFNDVTLRKQQEADLRRSREMYQALVTAGTYSVYRMSPDWHFMYQLDSETMEGTADPIENWLERYIPPEDYPEVLGAADRAIATKSLFELEHRAIFADGSIGWVLSRAVPLLDAQGEITEWFGAGTDITARRRTAERLRESEDRYRTQLKEDVRQRTAELKQSRDLVQATMDSSQDMIQVFEAVRDPSGRIVDFRWILNNRAAEMSFGEVIGQSLLTNNPGVRAEGIFDTFTRVTETGQPDHSERHYVHEQFDGWFLQTVVKLGDGVATTTKDITGWKAAQAEVLRLQEQIARARLQESEANLARELANTRQLQLISGLLIEGEDETRLYERILDAAMAIMRADCASLQTYDAKAGELRLLAHRNFHPASVRFWDRVSLPADLVQEGRMPGAGRMFAPDAAARDPSGRDHYQLSGIASMQSTPLMSRDGRLIGMISTHWHQPFSPDAGDYRFLDILVRQTADAFERSRAETALKESETRLAAIFANAPVGLSEISVEGRFLAVNQELCRILGRSREELLTLGIKDVTHVEDLDRSHALVEEVLAKGEARTIDKRYLRPDGRLIWASSVAHRLPVAGRDRHRLIVVSTDLTERHRAIEALRDSEERLRQFGNASSDVLWIRDAETMRWEYLSEAFGEIYGEDLDAALAGNDLHRWMEMILPEDRDHAQACVERVRNGERVTFEYRIRRPADGRIRWLRDTDFPLLDDEGRVQRIGGIGRDTTDEKEFSDRLQVLIAELQHRTRNLITVVKSLSGKTIKESASLDDFQARFNDRLSAISRVQGLLARLDGGSKITFGELLRAELGALGAINGQSGRVTMDGAEGIRLRSSTVQTFALALHELATNAIKYGALAAPAGRLLIRWHVDIKDDEEWLHVEWRESGVAMPETGAMSRGSGYGRELIERALPYQLKAETSYEMGPDGVHCRMAVPMRAPGPEDPDHG